MEKDDRDIPNISRGLRTRPGAGCMGDNARHIFRIGAGVERDEEAPLAVAVEEHAIDGELAAELGEELMESFEILLTIEKEA